MSTTITEAANKAEGKIQVHLDADSLPNLQSALIELIKAGLHSPNFPDYRDDLLTACDLLLQLNKSITKTTAQ